MTRYSVPHYGVMETSTTVQDIPERKSQIHQWMLARSASEFEQMDARGLNWPKLVAALAEDGITDGRRQAPTLATVKATFRSVKRAKRGT